MNTTTQTLLQIAEVKHIGGYMLRLRFDDDKIVTVDFGPFLKQSRHPEIRKYLKPELFKSWQLKHGDLMWGDFDLCFPVSNLYEGRV
jgi:hypothetical protein